MARHTFIQMSKLPDVKGRINYISSPKRQENLYATYSTCDDSFWSELAHENQLDFIKSGSAGKCIEARELIIALPEYYVQFDSKEVLKQFTDFFKSKYGVECISALHHNKTKTNYHIHMIFSERKYLGHILEKRATRNMFFDEKGRHVRTRSEITDENKNIRAGCKIVKKGEVYERQLFDKKIPLFKDKSFLAEVKDDYTRLINEKAVEKSDKLKVFESEGIYIATKKIGKNNPKESIIKDNNAAVQEWNKIASKVAEIMPTENIKAIKDIEISQAIATNIVAGHSNNFGNMLERAIRTLRSFTENWMLLEHKPTPDTNIFYRILELCKSNKNTRADIER